jgi:polar amino acid transport system substrate-binding protein
MRLSSRTLIGAGAAAALALSMAACGEQENTGQPGGGSSSAATTSVDEALAAKVPAEIKSDGKLVVGTDASYAPNEFLDTDGKTVIGFDVDLLKVVAGKLGLQVEYTAGQFDEIIPGVLSGKYEVGMSSFTINDDRKAQVNMVSYFSAGTQWAARKGVAVDPDNACGKRVAVQQGTVQVEDVTARSKACTDAGKPAITVEQFQGQDQATASLVSGKNDAMLADSPVCAYAVKQTNGELEVAGEIYDSAPYGYVIAKEQTALAEVVQDAVEAAIADGSYESALKKWGVEAGAIANPAVNP